MAKNPEVEAWFREYDNPMKPVVLAMRDVILAADRRLDECIKWKSPTFSYEGNLASFNPRSKKHASLMFHTGAQIPGDFPHLEGTGDVARYLKAASVEEVDALKTELVQIARAWCDSRSAGQPTTKKPVSKQRAAATSVKQRAPKQAGKKPGAQKSATKKSAAKKATTKSPAKKASKPTPTEKATAKKAPKNGSARRAAKKVAATASKKPAASKAPARQAAKKNVSKKAAVKKAAVKKAAVKKAAVKKAAVKRRANARTRS